MFQSDLTFFRTISGMVVGIVITSPGLLFAVPKHQCLLPKNVSYTRPSNADDQSCHLETTDNVTILIFLLINSSENDIIVHLRSLNLV